MKKIFYSMSLETCMFLKIKADSLICFNNTLTENEVEKNKETFFINLSLIHQLIIKKCFFQVKDNGIYKEVTRQIEFDQFVDEGVLNRFTLFFINEKDREFKRIKKAINALMIKGK